MDIWTVVHAVHLLAMAFFVGGQIMLAAVLVPVFRGRGGDDLKLVARRFGFGSLIALGLLILSGVELASHEHDWGNSVLMVKLGNGLERVVRITIKDKIKSQHIQENWIDVPWIHWPRFHFYFKKLKTEMHIRAEDYELKHGKGTAITTRPQPPPASQPHGPLNKFQRYKW